VIRGSWYGGVVPDRDFPRLLELYRDGALRIDPLVRRIGLDDINGAFDLIRSGDAVRSVIVYP
jgi:Zn-dependent alcohol dehydrogenase